MDGMNCMGGGCGAMMVGGWVVGLLVLVLLALGVLALVRYLRKSR